jgi:2,3-diketo-5-methylthio-1-phosphopentane phosphatase/HAD superfamily hydrolase (TIGR01549 family)
MDKRTENQPAAANPRILILCDFDGTVSTKDTVNRLVRDHATSPEWRYYVKRYMLGEIGSREVYQAVAPLMRMTHSDLEAFVRDHAALDPGFPPFLEWARGRGIDVKIVSDGFDATINALFSKHGISGLEIYANSLVLHDDGLVLMASPYYDPACGTCGTCKLGLLRKFRPFYDKIILIGDGESDRHAASEADAVLALHELFVYCARQGIPAVHVNGFQEIPRLLTRRIEAVTFDMDGTLVDSLGTITDAFNHMFARLGYPSMSMEEVVRHTSISLMDFVRAFLKPEEAEKGVRVFREYYDNIYLEKTTMISGAMETLSALNGTMLQGVVTNKRGRYARKLADHFGFSQNMARIIGAEDGFKAKPAGEMFEEFMRSVGTAKEKTIYVGDAPLDIEAAKNAGIDAFAVASSIFSAEELAMHKPRRVLNHITQLPAALQPLV